MQVIGITGGIGTGKSTVCEYLVKAGYGHIDADQIGRKLTADGSPILEIIKEKFGCVNPDLKRGGILVLDRKRLAALIFNDKVKKTEYDRLIHGEIIKEIDKRISYFRKLSVEGTFKSDVLLDAPLLFEAGLESRCDIVVLITAGKTARINRVSRRDGAGKDEIEARMKNQLSDEIKKQKADYILDNSKSKRELYDQLNNLFFLIKGVDK